MRVVDETCAKYGQAIAEGCRDEALLTKSLGVLQEDGVYAFFLYVASKSKKASKTWKPVSENSYALLKELLPRHAIGDEQEPLQAARQHLVKDLYHLLFAKHALERALVFARYHAKAFETPTREGD